MLRELLTLLIFVIVLCPGFGAVAQEDEPPIDPGDIIIPDLPDEDPYAEPGGEPVEPPGEETPAAAEIVLENTVALCEDGVDNDNDNHVDCADQDCEIFAICVKQPAAAPQAEPVQAQPEPEPAPEPVVVPAGYKRAESSKMRVLKIMGHVALWPGLGIAVLTTAYRFSDDSDYCDGDSDFLGVCSGWGWAVGGALAVTGVVLLSIYYTKRKRIVENNPELALSVSPLVGEGLYGVGGVVVF